LLNFDFVEIAAAVVGEGSVVGTSAVADPATTVVAVGSAVGPAVGRREASVARRTEELEDR